MQNEKFNLKSVYGYKFIVYASAVSVQLSVPFLLFFIPIIIAGAGCTSACVRLRLRACKHFAVANVYKYIHNEWVVGVDVFGSVSEIGSIADLLRVT